MDQLAPSPAELTALVARACRALAEARFEALSPVSVLGYRRAAERVRAAAEAAGDAWDGLERLTDARASYHVLRAAWSRWVHREVAAALRDLLQDRVQPAEAEARLRRWVPEAERYPHRPRADGAAPVGAEPGAWTRQLAEDGREEAAGRSKRAAIRSLPDTWVEELWQAAAARGFLHCDALSVLAVTGCRPAEVCDGLGVRLAPDGALEVAVPGRKQGDLRPALAPAAGRRRGRPGATPRAAGGRRPRRGRQGSGALLAVLALRGHRAPRRRGAPPGPAAGEGAEARTGAGFRTRPALNVCKHVCMAAFSEER